MAVARTLRVTSKISVTFSMLYHLEHHFFPRVPTCKPNIPAQQINTRTDAGELKYVP